MGEIINFSDKKTAMDRDRSDHFVSLDLFMNSDTSDLWASVSNVGEVDIDPDWHRFIAGQLRHLAWIADGMAADADGTNSHPIASVTVFEDRRISTRWNDDLVNTAGQVGWVGEQLLSGVDEIRAAQKEQSE
tara:strand:- start:22431 stop:22826 length:396 start_codon:yes stop_codon:yes gene_type:complete